MDFRFTPAQEQMRADIQAFLTENLPAEFEEPPLRHRREAP